VSFNRSESSGITDPKIAIKGPDCKSAPTSFSAPCIYSNLAPHWSQNFASESFFVLQESQVLVNAGLYTVAVNAERVVTIPNPNIGIPMSSKLIPFGPSMPPAPFESESNSQPVMKSIITTVINTTPITIIISPITRITP
jgi:hypothetical protein